MINNDIRGPEDLSPVISSLFLKDSDMRFLSFVNFLFGNAKITRQKHEWVDDQARVVELTLTASGAGADWDTDSDTTALPLASGLGAQVRVGDVIELASGEVVVVSAVSVANDTVDLYARGHGSTTAAAQGTSAFTGKIIGNAQVEDGDPIATNHVADSEVYNYTQIFEDVIQVTGTQQRSRELNGGEHDRQVVKKTKELMRTLNRALIYGIRNLDTTNKVSTMAGIKELGTTTYNVSGALTEAKLYAALTAMINAGGSPTQIHAPISVIATIEQFYTGLVRYEASDNYVGLHVKKLEMMGLTLELYPDRDIDSGEMYIVDKNRVSYGPLAGGSESGKFQSYRLYDKDNAKQQATQIAGEYTLEMRNVAGAITRAYGIT